MGKEFLHTIDIVKFRNAFPVSDTVGIGDDFFVLDMRYDSCLDVLMHPCRLDAYLAFFCIGGSLKFSINLREFEVGENTLAVNIPGNILQVIRLDETGKDNLHFVVAAMSREYVSRMHIDVGRLFSEGMTLLDNPAVTLTAEERKIAGNYFDLVHNVLTSPLLYKRECVSSLVSSVFYLVAGVLSRNIRLSAAVSAGTGNGTTGARAVFDSFIRAVTKYHTKERTIAFYAGQLHMTPKYLSRTVMDASGKTASEWIDSYVIMEARNMLRHSDMNIKEIADALNFTGQSAFYKYFMRKTGQTPGQYRKNE